MSLPKISFIFSSVYNRHFSSTYSNNYPTDEEILARKTQAEEYWSLNSEKILSEISKQSGLDWKSNEIKVYIVGKSVPFSSPLTMPLKVVRSRGDTNEFEDWVDVLVHELIHNILVDNNWSEKEGLKRFFLKYKEASMLTKIHVPVHAVHEAVYKSMFTEERLENDKKFCKDVLSEYARAWDIVENEGYKNIIQMIS